MNLQSTRKERVGWYFYDWANSVFYTSVITVFLGPYLTAITKSAADIHGFIHVLGLPIHYGSFFPYIISMSVILQLVFLPFLGAIADYTKLRKMLLGIFAYIGSGATVCLYFIDSSNYLWGGLLFILANLSFGASVVMYNSFLTELAEPERRDTISSIGWGFGYIGGGVLLGLNLIFYMNANALQISSGLAVRICLASAGVWWAFFTIIPMITLRTVKFKNPVLSKKSLFVSGWKELRQTIKDAKNYPNTLTFLVAYLLYNDGVQSVIAMSASFGQEELGLSMSTLTTIILIVQFVAFFGSIFFSFIASHYGAKKSIQISLVVWVLITIYAFGFLYTVSGFYILAIFIAIVLGGTQALSRSIFAGLIPVGKESEYFSLYEVSEKGTSWIGTMIFGLTLQFSGSYRLAVLSLSVFFILGFVILYRVKTSNFQTFYQTQ